jgi:hypothetical protein
MKGTGKPAKLKKELIFNFFKILMQKDCMKPAKLKKELILTF